MNRLSHDEVTVRSITDARLGALVNSSAPQARAYERELRSAERAYLDALAMADTRLVD